MSKYAWTFWVIVVAMVVALVGGIVVVGQYRVNDAEWNHGKSGYVDTTVVE